MVVTYDPFKIEPFREFFTEEALKLEPIEYFNKFFQKADKVFSSAVEERKIFPYRALVISFLSDLMKSKTKRFERILKNEKGLDNFIIRAISTNDSYQVYSTNLEEEEAKPCIDIIDRNAPKFIRYFRTLENLETALLLEARIAPLTGSEFEDFFPLANASVIVYERMKDGQMFYNNLVLKTTKDEEGKKIVEYDIPINKFETEKEAIRDADDNSIKTIAVCKNMGNYPFRETVIEIVRKKYEQIVGL